MIATETRYRLTRQLWIAAAIILGILAIAYLNVFQGLNGGIVALGAATGLIITGLVLRDYRIGVYLLCILGVFMFYVERLFELSLPFGVAYDLLTILTGFAVIIVTPVKNWKGLLNPTTILFLILMSYQLLEFFNPEGVFLAWLVSLRNYTSFLFYIVCFQMLCEPENVQNFTVFWISIALLVALYGIYQQIFGLADFELRWIYSDPVRYHIYFIWGQMRKFSFLSDPSSYGLYMAFAGLSCFVLTVRLRGFAMKCVFGLITMIMLTAMSYSGTRTAYATVVVGIALYILLTLKNRRTMLIATAFILAIAFVFLAPIHSWQINRIRSTFQPEADPSMGVRDTKRLRYQSFVQSHPFGAGMYTTAINGENFAPHHELAGFDPDSGYLETALEEGWVGLVLLMLFFFVSLWRGISGYYRATDPNVRTTILVYLVPFFALTISHFAQNAVFPKPVNFLAFASMAILGGGADFIKLPFHEKS